MLTKRKAKVDRFLREVGRPYKSKRHIKSLGYTQAFGGRRKPEFQNKKAQKACEALTKVARLPVPVQQKVVHVHANGHSKWVFGSEVLAPSARCLRSLRAAVVRCVVPKKCPVTSPYLTLATRADPFLDPFGKWASHVFSRLRKMSRKNRALVVQSFVAPRPQRVKSCVRAMVSLACWRTFAVNWHGTSVTRKV